MDLEIEREFQRWAEAEEATYFDELNAKAKAILDTENIQLLTGELIDNGGRLSPIIRSAKELLAEMDSNAGDVIMNCMLRG
jgi:hypothetical protein